MHFSDFRFDFDFYYDFGQHQLFPAAPPLLSPDVNQQSGARSGGGGGFSYFKPIIPLPDKVDVKTGEEEEVALYSHRAKLFRYTDGEWKERGVGDIKILKHRGTGKVRLLMRREQVLKICLNHYITRNLVAQFKEKDTKSWTWAAQDFSEGELESMTFALRFKTPEISTEFKKALDDAAKDATASPAKTDNHPQRSLQSLLQEMTLKQAKSFMKKITEGRRDDDVEAGNN